MKRLIHIVFLLLACMVVHAEKKTRKGYEVIYQSGYKSVRLLDVERTDTATIVSMRCSMLPGDKFTLPQKELYIDDELQNRYHLKYTRNIVLGDTVICPYSGFYDFSLVFEPLPSSVEVFDLRAANEWYSAFAFWGIHQNKQVTRKIKHIEDVVRLEQNDVALASSANAVIKGRIKGYTSSIKRDTLSLQTRAFNEGQIPRNVTIKHYAEVDDNGKFEFTIPINNKYWTYIEGNKTSIPVFLIPNDTITLTVEQYKEVDMHVMYQSSDGNYTMEKLMHTDPRWVDWEFATDRYVNIRPDELMGEVHKRKRAADTLADYLVWKYKLSRVESHMLRLQMYSFIYEIAITRLNKNLHDVYFRRNGFYQTDYQDGLIHIPEIVDSYGFLKDIRTDDYTYFMLPSQYLLIHLANIEPVRYPQTTELRFKILEEYLGHPINNEWKKRIEL